MTQREVMLELLEVSPASVPQPKPLPKIAVNDDPESAGEQVRTFLGVSEADQSRAADAREALNLWLAAAEAQGILVIQTAGIPLEEMRGFSVSEWPYPVVALNGSDWPRPRLFTLLHEIAHLSLNVGGICDLSEPGPANRRTEANLEQMCNSIAASALLPASALLRHPLVTGRSYDHDWPLEDLATLSRRFGASSEAVLLRLITLNRATWETYNTRRAELTLGYQEAREAERQRRKEAEGGPSYYVVKARDIGHAYASSVLDAYRANRISALDVAEYLTIRYSQLRAFEAVVR